MLLFSSGIYAACTKKDIAGIWHVNVHAVDNPNNPEKKSDHVLFRCTLNVTKIGAITTPSICYFPYTPDPTNYSYLPIPVQGGTLFIDNICKVSGYITLENFTIPIDEAWLNKGRDVLSGVGMYPVGWLTFDAIKQ